MRLCYTRFRAMVIVSVTFSISMPILAPSASADAIYGALRNSGGAGVDGIVSEVTLDAIGPTPHSCVAFDVVSYDAVTSNQIEAGWIRCGQSTNFDANQCGTTSGSVVAYSEISYQVAGGFAYHCSAFGGGSVGQTHQFAARQDDPASHYNSFMDGAPSPDSLILHDPQILVWGEMTTLGGAVCSTWSGSGVFKNTRTYNWPTGTHAFATFPSQTFYLGANEPSPPPLPCWAFGPWNGAAGSVHIFKT